VTDAPPRECCHPGEHEENHNNEREAREHVSPTPLSGFHHVLLLKYRK
jgi:hypothetical protein